MEQNIITDIVEALLLVSEKPLKLKTLFDFFQKRKEGVEEEHLQAALEELKKKHSAGGIELQEVAGGYQLATRKDFGEWVKGFLNIRTVIKLTRSSIETLAIVAYKQPVTKGEIDYVRGVDSSNPVKSLLLKKLIIISGRKKAPGNPLTYATSEEFLKYFGMKDLADLPSMEEIADISGSEEEPADSGPEDEPATSGADSEPSTGEENKNENEEIPEDITP